MERVDLSTPIVKPDVTTYEIGSLLLELRPNPRIVVTLVGSDGTGKVHEYTGSEALTMLRALNTAPLNVKSLHRRVMERLIADGVIGGTISGVPDA